MDLMDLAPVYFRPALNDPMAGLMQAAMRSKSKPKPGVRMDLRAEEARPAARRRIITGTTMMGRSRYAERSCAPTRTT